MRSFLLLAISIYLHYLTDFVWMACFSTWSLPEKSESHSKKVRWASAPSLLSFDSVTIDVELCEPAEEILNTDPPEQNSENPNQSSRNVCSSCSYKCEDVVAFVAFIIFCVSFGWLFWKFVTRP